MKRNFRRRAAVPVFAALLLAAAASAASAQGPARNPAFVAALAEQLPGAAVSRVGALSDYVPSLAGTALDSPVYFIEPAKPSPDSPAILILGAAMDRSVYALRLFLLGRAKNDLGAGPVAVRRRRGNQAVSSGH